jgi:hypothetical protein
VIFAALPNSFSLRAARRFTALAFHRMSSARAVPDTEYLKPSSLITVPDPGA